MDYYFDVIENYKQQISDESYDENEENPQEEQAVDEDEDDYNPIVTNTLTKAQILEIFCHSE